MAEVLGTDDDDILEGGDAADVLSGGRGSDVLIGGGGADLYVFEEGDSATSDGLIDPSFLDLILGFEPTDRLLFKGAEPAAAETLFPGVAVDYEDALAMARDAFDAGFEYASIKVDADVYVFALRVDSVVKLDGVDPGQVGLASFASGDGGQDGRDVGSIDDETVTFITGENLYDAGVGADTLQGGDGTDSLSGGPGDDAVYGGDGADSLTGDAGANYLRGQAGDDVAQGGDAFDDINGNMGRDTIFAGGGDDWLRGGKDDDVLFGGEGNDLVSGDLGSDTVGGGMGDDVLRGGPGSDLVRGDDGADTLYGESGTDTLEGGLGADIFVLTQDTGTDVVVRFNAAQGDRVALEPDAIYTVAQIDEDTVITLADGGQMVLADVQLSTLPSDWLQVA